MTAPAAPRLLPVLALVLATFFWGSSFLTISTALEETNPLTLVLCRFGTAAFLLAFALRGRIRAIPASTWKGGAWCGLAIYCCYTANTAGLMTIESSMSGFLTALYVPLTPFLYWIVYGRTPSKAAFAGAGLAFAGLVLLANPFTLSLSNNWGEWVTILSALLSAAEILIVGKFAPQAKATELAFAQLVFVTLFAALGLAVATLAGVPLKETVWSPVILGSIAWLAVIVAFVQVLLAYGQRYVPPGRACVIFAMESVFAAALGWIVGERLGAGGLAGGLCIVGGILLSELPALFKRKRK